MKILFHYPPTLSFIYINKANPKILTKAKVAKNFSHWNARAKEKKEKDEGQRKWKVKVKSSVSLLNPQTISNLLSAHAWTLEDDILHKYGTEGS